MFNLTVTIANAATTRSYDSLAEAVADMYSLDMPSIRAKYGADVLAQVICEDGEVITSRLYVKSVAMMASSRRDAQGLWAVVELPQFGESVEWRVADSYDLDEDEDEVYDDLAQAIMEGGWYGLAYHWAN